MLSSFGAFTKNYEVDVGLQIANLPQNLPFLLKID